jgi:hypothetical protein
MKFPLQRETQRSKGGAHYDRRNRRGKPDRGVDRRLHERDRGISGRCIMKFFVPDHGHISRRDYCLKHGIGMLYSPHRTSNLPKESGYFLDNGAYPAFLKGKTLDVEAYRGFIEKCRIRGKPYGAIIPDIVRGGRESYNFSTEHFGVIPTEIQKYFVVNPEITKRDLKPYLEEIDGLFLSLISFKRPSQLSEYIDLAHNHGLRAHIGRVGTYRSFSLAMALGADSVDGSTLMRHNTLTLLPKWIERTKSQAVLPDTEEIEYPELCVRDLSLSCLGCGKCCLPEGVQYL